MADQPANRYRYLLSLDQFPADLVGATALDTRIDAWVERWQYKDCMCTQGATKFRCYVVTAVKPSAMRKRVTTHFSSHVRGAKGFSARFGGVRYSLTQAKLGHEEVMQEMLMGDREDVPPALVQCTWVFPRHPTDLHAQHWADRRSQPAGVAPRPRPAPRWSEYVPSHCSVTGLRTVHDIHDAICSFHTRNNTPPPALPRMRRVVAKIQEWVRLQRAAGLELCRALGLLEQEQEQEQR